MKNRPAYLLLLPTIIAYLLFFVVPVVQMGWLSFFRARTFDRTFIGFANFIGIFQDQQFGRSILNTFAYVGLTIPAQIILSLAFVLLAVNMRKWAQNTIRFITYIPVFLAGVIISTVYNWIFHAPEGLANWLIGLVGMKPVIWLGSASTAIPAMSMIIALSMNGFFVVYMMAVTLSITSETYEAAMIDGATWWQIKWHIVLPHLKPTILLLTLLGIVGNFQIFEVIYFLTNGGPAGETASIQYDIYSTGVLRGHYGLANAKTVVFVLIVLAVGYAKRRLDKRLSA
uniref:Putative transporter domain contining protein n=1 Tax=viral metagenome TaxID=1070528 RepID=A0A6M3LA91_9ZZZZ